MVLIVLVPVTDADEEAPMPGYPELVQLSPRIDHLLSTENEADAHLAAQSFDFVEMLRAELDRGRPRQAHQALRRA